MRDMPTLPSARDAAEDLAYERVCQACMWARLHPDFARTVPILAAWIAKWPATHHPDRLSRGDAARQWYLRRRRDQP